MSQAAKPSRLSGAAGGVIMNSCGLFGMLTKSLYVCMSIAKNY